MSEQDLEEVKKLMLNGAVPLECKKCASLEEGRISSPRQQYQKEFPDYSKIQYLDLVINNDCNLECVMCSPAYSVRLNTIYTETFPEEVMPSWRINLDELAKTDLSHFEFINIIGGEPLSSKDAYRFLDSLTKKKKLKKLRIVTNLTKLPDHWKEIFENVDELEMIASIDATDKLYEFIRYPARFETVKDNVKKLKSWNLNHLQLHQHVVLMNLNFGYLSSILEFYDEFFTNPLHRLPIFVEISSPQVLHPRVLTKNQWETAKTDVLLAIEQLEQKYGTRKEFEDFKNLVLKMEQIDLKHLYIDYKIYLEKIKKYHP